MKSTGTNAHIQPYRRDIFVSIIQKIGMSKAAAQSKNLGLFPPDKFTNAGDIIEVVENSGAEIVVIDDLNGLLLENTEVERFMYQLKAAASRKKVILFVIYNLCVPQKRTDMRPTLKDFPSDSYYRLFDVVQFTFRPVEYYEKLYDKTALELIWAKGLPSGLTVRMYAPEEVTSVIEHQQHD